MISCPNRFCDTAEKLVVLKPGDPLGPYYCRRCGHVVTKEKAETLLASEKFVAAVEPLEAPEPDPEPAPAKVPLIKKLARSKRSKKKGGKK